MTLLGKADGFLEVEPHDPADRRVDRDVILLLHGTGGNKQEWSFPVWRGVNYDHQHDPPWRHDNNNLTPPIDIFPPVSLSNKKDVRCWRTILLALGHTIIYYSQDNPNGEIDAGDGALQQFEGRIVPFIRQEILTGNLAGKRVTIVAHSRGGILARYYMANHPADAESWIQRVITMCSPHGGTEAPLAARRLRDELILLLGVLAPSPTTALLALIARLGIDVDPTDAQRQLLPGSPLFTRLSQPDDTPNIEFYTFGGTSVRVARIYGWLYTPDSFVPTISWGTPYPHFDWTMIPVEISPISPMLDKIPDFAVFSEQRQGEGDICVTVESTKLHGVPHQSLPINHGEALFDEMLFAQVAGLLGTPLGGTVAEPCTMGWVGNSRTHELHEIARETSQCQLDEIVSPWPFSLPDEAFDVGYDGCAYCMPEDHHPEVHV